MSLTWSQLKYATRASVNQLSSRGVIKPDAKVADMVLKLKYFINPLLYELANTTGKLGATKNYLLNPVDNTLSYDTSTIRQFTGADFTAELVGAKAYFFEASGPATIYVEEHTGGAWAVLDTISIGSDVTELTEYKGLITASDEDNKVRLRFSGTSPYGFRNYKLYTYTWATADEVQQHRPFFKFTMPADFLKLNEMYIKKDTRQYVTFTPDKVEEPSTFWVNRYLGPAEIQMKYWRIPTLLTWTEPNDIDDAETMDVTPDAEGILHLAMAAAFFRSIKDDTSATIYQNLWEVGLSKLAGNDGTYMGTVVSASYI